MICFPPPTAGSSQRWRPVALILEVLGTDDDRALFVARVLPELGDGLASVDYAKGKSGIGLGVPATSKGERRVRTHSKNVDVVDKVKVLLLVLEGVLMKVTRMSIRKRGFGATVFSAYFDDRDSGIGDDCVEPGSERSQSFSATKKAHGR